MVTKANGTQMDKRFWKFQCVMAHRTERHRNGIWTEPKNLPLSIDMDSARDPPLNGTSPDKESLGCFIRKISNMAYALFGTKMVSKG